VRVKKRKTEIDISKKDNGVERNELQIKNLFDISKHTITSGANMEKGTGLALVLCKEFVDIHNGKVILEPISD
jgi:signal transduction histidine kinase|tara:strand:- start:259 stop:477 length:219 start_codon:yes stop_codon:yes gene_type:complete